MLTTTRQYLLKLAAIQNDPYVLHSALDDMARSRLGGEPKRIAHQVGGAAIGADLGGLLGRLGGTAAGRKITGDPRLVALLPQVTAEKARNAGTALGAGVGAMLGRKAGRGVYNYRKELLLRKLRRRLVGGGAAALAGGAALAGVGQLIGGMGTAVGSVRGKTER